MKGVRLLAALVGSLFLIMLAGCGMTAEERAECEAWLEGLRPVYGSLRALRDSMVTLQEARNLTGLIAVEPLAAAEVQAARIVSDIDALGQAPAAVAARVGELRGAIELVRQGFALMAQAARGGNEALWDEGRSVLSEGVRRNNESYVPYCGNT